MKNNITTQAQIRYLFWTMAGECGKARRKGGHNAQTAEVRAMFSDFVDGLARSGSISEKLAQRATMG